jgi:hypothetical protein
LDITEIGQLTTDYILCSTEPFPGQKVRVCVGSHATQGGEARVKEKAKKGTGSLATSGGFLFEALHNPQCFK